MKQHYILSIILLSHFFFTSVNAQTWQWGERGGSADGTVGSGANEYPVDVAVDQNGNSYVLSYNVGKTSLSVGSQSVTKNFGSYDIMLASFNCGGQLRWIKIIGCKAEDRADALCTDKNGGVYISFRSILASGNTNDVYFDNDATKTISNTQGALCYKSVFLAKYDTSGNFKWATDPQPDTVGLHAISYTGIIDMEIDDNGDLHCLSVLPPGIFENSYVVNKQGTYILKYNSNGTFLGGVAPDINVTSYSIGSAYLKRDNKYNRYLIAGSVEYLGPVYISGKELMASKYIAAFDNNGKLLWSRTDTNMSRVHGIRNRPVIDDLGNIYVVANTEDKDYFNGYTTKADKNHSTVMLMKMNKDGDMLWASNAQVTSAAIFSYGITFRNSGEVILTGANVGLTKWDTYGYRDSITTPDATYRPFIARFNTQTGKLLEMDDLIATGKNSYPLDIISDGRNSVYIGGELGGSLKINGATLSSVGGTKDFFVAKYGYADCNCTNIPEPEFTQTVANHFNYSFTYAGTAGTTMEWDFGDGNTSTQTSPTHTYTTVGDFIACVKVTNNCGDNIYCTKISTKWPAAIGTIEGSNIKIYPNPANDVLYVEGVEPGSRIELYDILGRKAHEIITAKEKEVINISYLPAGNYIIQLTDKNGQRITGKVVKR